MSYINELDKFYSQNIGVGSDEESYFRQGFLAGQRNPIAVPAPALSQTIPAPIDNLIVIWRDYANGHYCQTYNTGMAEGLLKAAKDLRGAIDVVEAALSDREWTPAEGAVNEEAVTHGD